jgi:hypothetical protein
MCEGGKSWAGYYCTICFSAGKRYSTGGMNFSRKVNWPPQYFTKGLKELAEHVEKEHTEAEIRGLGGVLILQN